MAVMPGLVGRFGVRDLAMPSASLLVLPGERASAVVRSDDAPRRGEVAETGPEREVDNPPVDGPVRRTAAGAFGEVASLAVRDTPTAAGGVFCPTLCRALTVLELG